MLPPLYISCSRAHSLPSFTLGGAISLQEYLGRFEKHCETSYAGSFDDALPLLKTLLTEKMVDVFDACGGTDTSYARLKQRMLRWFEKQDSSDCQTAKQRFENCKRRQKESLSLFALRLSSLFEDAYPSADMQTSTLLRDRLLDNLPLQAVDHLKKQERYNKAIHGITMKWDNYIMILQCEQFEDGNSSLFFSRESRSAESAEGPRRQQTGGSETIPSDRPGGGQRGRHRSPSCNTCRRNLQSDSSSSELDCERTQRSRRKKRKETREETSRERRSPDKRRRDTVKTCKFCHRRGHSERECWRKYRSLQE